MPRWRGDGKEIFYLALDGKLMAARITKLRAASYRVRLNRGVAIKSVAIPNPNKKSRSVRIAVMPPSLRRMALKPWTA